MARHGRAWHGMASQGVGEKAAKERIRVYYYALLPMHHKVE